MCLDLRGGVWQPAGCVLGDSFSVAWRVYDAQYWGVPQRRKRIYLIADFATRRAPEILFEREGLRGDIEACEKTGQDSAADAEGSAGRGCIVFKERAGKPGGGKGLLPAIDRAFTLSTNVDQSVCYALQGNGIDRADTAGYNGCGWRKDKMYTLNTVDRPAVVCLNDQGGNT